MAKRSSSKTAVTYQAARGPGNRDSAFSRIPMADRMAAPHTKIIVFTGGVAPIRRRRIRVSRRRVEQITARMKMPKLALDAEMTQLSKKPNWSRSKGRRENTIAPRLQAISGQNPVVICACQRTPAS